jgi:hypothetical protein
MKIYNPLYGDMIIPDTNKDIISELLNAIEIIQLNYSRRLQVYIDTLNEGLDIISR